MEHFLNAKNLKLFMKLGKFESVRVRASVCVCARVFNEIGIYLFIFAGTFFVFIIFFYDVPSEIHGTVLSTSLCLIFEIKNNKFLGIVCPREYVLCLLFLAYFPKTGLRDLLPVCVCESHPTDF
jgi:hypothetical protein